MLKQFFKYIFQSIAGMIGISVYILADTFFISVHSGADGLAVLNLILPVYGVVYAIGAMIGIGSATRFGINRAKGEDTDHYFLQSVFWSVLCSVPFIITGIFAPEKFLHLLGADAGLTALGKSYLRIMLITTPLFMTNYTFTAFARNDQGTSTAMTGAISASLFNIVFDYIFMFPMKLGKRITWDSGGYGLPSVIWFPAVSLEFRLLWESFPQRLLRSFLTCCFLELREM